MADYKLGKPEKKPRRKRRWLIALVCLVLLISAGGWYLKGKLRPDTVIKQAKPITTKVSYQDSAVKHYDEPDFGIDLPSSWQPLPRPAGPYQSYNWQLLTKGDGTEFTIYEDTIPGHFAVNRVVIIEPEVDHVSLKGGGASDNCSAYTTSAPSAAYSGGALAKWQDVNFLCDQSNTERDVIGTSSSDGINTVILKSQTTGHVHKFFFTYTDHAISPDYTVFYSMLNSFRLK